MKTILLQELMHYFKNKIEAIYLYSYFVSIVLLAPFAYGEHLSKIQHIAPLALWIALASGVALGASSLFRRDVEQGRLEYCQLLPVSLEAVVFAKWLGFYLFLLLPICAILPVAGLLFNLPVALWGHYFLGLGVGAAALSLLSALIAAITSGMEKAGAVLSLVILPLSIPIMIVGSDYCRNASSLWQPQLGFLIGFSLFLLPVLCLGGASSIRASN